LGRIWICRGAGASPRSLDAARRFPPRPWRRFSRARPGRPPVCAGWS
jgi:hypothetical protein